jgi:hypothetical protein
MPENIALDDFSARVTCEEAYPDPYDGEGDSDVEQYDFSDCC